MNWLKLGLSVAPFVASIVISVIIVILVFKRYVAPELMANLEEAQKTITNLAKLAGVKSQEFAVSRNLGKDIAADLIKEKFPEAEALKMILSPSTWEKVEEAMEESPEAILQLIEKYGPVLGIGGMKQQEPLDF